MGHAESFNWAAFGEANYATVGQWFRMLPQSFRNTMNRSEQEVFTWIIFYAWRSALKSGRGTAYASFSQEKLGEKFGRSRWTVARALDRLEGSGLLHRINRRPLPGKSWQTNLYYLTGRLLMMLKSCLTRKPKQTPCSKSAPQVFHTNNIIPEHSAPADAGAVLRIKETSDAPTRALLTRFFSRTFGS